MKNILATLMAIFAIPAAASASDISPKQAADMIKEQSVVIIDVRTPEEFADGHIANSINIDFYESDFKKKAGLLDISKTYVIYCRSGRRSASAEKILKDMGFKNLYNVKEGIIGWKNGGLPVVK